MAQTIVPPLLQIELEIEAAPRIRLVCANESEEKRLKDWIANVDAICDLVVLALELADGEEQAA